MTTIGLVGCGRWGRNILRDLRALGAEVHVAESDDDARSGALRSGAASVVTCHHDLPRCDGIVVAVPISATGGVVLELLARQVPIFVEKPMAHSVETARAIVQSSLAPVFVMDKWRYHPAVEAARDMLDHTIGRVSSIRLERWGWWDSPRDVSSLWWLAPHDLSMLFHWLGTVPAVVWAERITQRGVDDYLIVLGGADGPTVTIDLRVSSATNRRSFTIEGEWAAVHLADADADRLIVREYRVEQVPSERSVPLDGSLPLETELRWFLAYLRGGPPPLSSAADGLMVVERLAEIERCAGT